MPPQHVSMLIAQENFLCLYFHDKTLRLSLVEISPAPQVVLSFNSKSQQIIRSTPGPKNYFQHMLQAKYV